MNRRGGQERVLRAAGAGGLAGGAALVTHIVGGVSLRAALAAAILIVVLGVAAVLRRAGPIERKRFGRAAAVGAAAGLLATVAYDASRTVLAYFDPSPYNPFEAIRVFGTLLAGETAPRALVSTAGIAFHCINGTGFGVAFALLLGRRGLLAGIVWGLGLELFQLTLYPGWLEIRAFREFARISAVGHLVYGGVLGSSCRRWLDAVGGSG
ncbi:MAG: hypothetical protein QN141_03475 [Armatimonadota bacterium]|nr:hypothetical protein [Armatimonadota bacterium]MDR7451404.1 hypothetical protein [Armatimonadota bacterium]MDR7466446.1 hypothetical protein [Armatimonadota bacterium]MDR7493168.1 hypothetical protein [Armatimonadota bacterium]MDR7500357.1 hypothetical protein [Armatimonadota bacterium]